MRVRHPVTAVQANVGLALILHHNGVVVFGDDRGLRQPRVSACQSTLASLKTLPSTGRDTSSDSAVAARRFDLQRAALMRRLHPNQFDADRRMGDVRAGNIAQAGHLHLVAHQRCAVLRHDHHHHFAAGFLQLVEEGVQLIEQLLRTWLIVGALVGADEAVAVVQRDDVEEGGGAAVTAFCC